MSYKIKEYDSLIQESSNWDFNSDGDPSEFVSEMISVMQLGKGIGLAANQIGITKRIFVMGAENLEGFPTPFAVVNPEIIGVSEETSLYKEGCLSFPGLFLSVNRPKEILVKYQNEKGEWFQSTMNGLIARCFQHELDHLNGICFVEKVSKLKLKLAMGKLKK